MTRRLNRWLFFLILLVCPPFYWFFLDNRPGDAHPRPLSIVQLRELAAGSEGPAPTSIHFEAVASRLQSGNVIAAGSGMRLDRRFVHAFLLQRPGARPVMIDTGITGQQARENGYGVRYINPQQRVERALEQAAIVITLGDSPEHAGGLKPLDRPKRSQNRHLRIESPDTAPESPEPFAVAQGIVVIPTEGLRGRSRMVFVRLRDGSEFLFTGDVARSARNWDELRAPARIETDFRHPENRQTIYEWLLAIRALRKQAPKLVIVSGDGLHELPDLKHIFPVSNES